MKKKFMTTLTHAGKNIKVPDNSDPKVFPIYMSSGFTFKDAQMCNDVCFEKKEGYLYGSYGNPSTDVAREIIRDIEGGEACQIFATGMAAISLAILSQAKTGDHIIAHSVIFGNTFKLLKTELQQNFGIEVSLVDFEKDDLKKHFKANTKLVYMESISNPLMGVLDTRRIAEIARGHNCKLMIDNTFATPLVVRPLDFGADIVVYSATKFLNGHSDIMAGVVVADKKTIQRVTELSHSFGPIISPMEAWLLTRGLRTLGLRMERHCQNALELARALEKNKKVKKVYYSGLESSEYHALANELFNGVYGGMAAIDLGSYANISRFTKSTEFLKPMASLASFSTTLCDTTITHSSMTAREREEMGIPEGLLRISAGLEDFEDIIEEFERVLLKL